MSTSLSTGLEKTSDLRTIEQVGQELIGLENIPLDITRGFLYNESW